LGSITGGDAVRRADLFAAAIFVTLAVVMSWPLVAHLATSVAGPPGDNLAFLWNFWWMREAVTSGVSPLHTPFLFAPAGVDLTLNTHTALPAFVGATVFGPWTVATAHNLTLVAILALNGFCAYLLAGRMTSDAGSRVAAGVVFAVSSSITVRLLGHFNLACAFVLPLFALAWPRALAGSLRAAAVTGLVLAATAYTDYYYVVFELVVGVCLLLSAVARWSIIWRQPNRATRVVARVAVGGAALALLAVAAIVITGGFVLRVGAWSLSMKTTFNPLQMFWVFAAIGFVFWTRPAIAIGWRTDWQVRRAVVAIVLAAGVFALAAWPLVQSGAKLIATGDYVSQQYFWRSAPGGVDLATAVLGNPMHPIWGPRVVAMYQRLGLDRMESVAWLGLVPLALVVIAVRRCRAQPAVRMWLGIGMVFLLWAFGPHLVIAGRNTGLVLPEALLRFVPIAANARIPGRAMVAVCLAVAMLAAVALSYVRERSRKPGLVLGLCLSAVLIEQLPAPLPLTMLETPSIYTTLRDRPEQGSLIELPLGLDDGLGEATFDRRLFLYQMTHRRPIAGGFVARLPASVRRAYDSDVLLATLLALSDSDVTAPASLPDRQRALERLRADAIDFVMLNRATAPETLVEYVEHTMPVTPIANDGRRSLYVVSGQ
jgi:hypothetical protein